MLIFSERKRHSTQTPHQSGTGLERVYNKLALRWLDWIFLGGYLPSLSINYVAMSKDMGKRLPQLYYIRMKFFC